MENRNPYASPRASVADPKSGQAEYGEIRVFSAQGRLGRIRYIGYCAGLTLLIGLVLGLLALAVGSAAAPVLVVVGYLAIMVVQILLTIQRAHDFNSSGWLSVLMFVPLVNLIFWFIPGTQGANQFGNPPPPNTVGVIILGCLVPVIFFIGILAAIAIPAYQDYTIRAQVSEGLNLAVAPKAAIADAFRRDGTAPVDRMGAGMSAAATDTSGKYVASIDVARGTILVTFGAEANAVIAGRTLALQPYVMPDRNVVWRCGEGVSPGTGGVAMDAGAVTAGEATDIDARFLPSLCRPVVR